jgi:putative MATE family efflux protein
MVGRLGEMELASVGLSVQIFFVHWMVLFGFNGGASAFLAQFWGKQDLPNIRRTIGVTVTVCFSLSVCFFLPAILFPEAVLSIFTNIPEVVAIGRDYIRICAVCFLASGITVPFTAALRATGQTALPLKISVFAFGTNTFLNYLFIFGSLGAPQLGVRGAALATAIARLLELTLMLGVVFGGRNLIAGRVREFFSWKKELFLRIIGNALPTTANETLWGLGATMYNAAYGRIGVTAYAAVQAGATIQNLFSLACFSLGDAALIIVGAKLGRGEREEAFESAGRILRFGIVVGVLAGALMFGASRFLVRLFEFTPEGIHNLQIILMIYSAFLVVKIYNAIIITGILRCGGDAKFAMYAEVGCVWGIGVPLAFFGALYLHLPVYLSVLLVQMEELTKLSIMIRRFRSRKWVKNLVHDLQ